MQRSSQGLLNVAQMFIHTQEMWTLQRELACIAAAAHLDGQTLTTLLALTQRIPMFHFSC